MLLQFFIEGELSYVQTFDSLATSGTLYRQLTHIKLQNQISDVPITDSLFVQDNGYRHFITLLNDIDGDIAIPSVLQ